MFHIFICVLLMYLRILIQFYHGLGWQHLVPLKASMHYLLLPKQWTTLIYIVLGLKRVYHEMCISWEDQKGFFVNDFFRKVVLQNFYLIVFGKVFSQIVKIFEDFIFRFRNGIWCIFLLYLVLFVVFLVQIALEVDF